MASRTRIVLVSALCILGAAVSLLGCGGAFNPTVVEQKNAQLQKVKDDATVAGAAAQARAAQDQIDKNNAALAKGSAQLDSFQRGLQTFSTTATVVAPLLGPWGEALLAAVGVAGAVGTGVQTLRKRGADRATAQAKTDATSALDAQTDVANHAATPGATPTGVQNYVATVVSGLTAGAAALYNAAPEVRIALVNDGGTPINKIAVV